MITQKLLYAMLLGMSIYVIHFHITNVEETYVIPEIDQGLIQSPINIITEDLITANHHIDPNYKPTHEEIIHKKHTVEVEYDPGSFIVFDDIKYTCNQFHFHTPSEHLIDGVTYPMELHLVHSEYDEKTQNDLYFVISVLFKMGEKNDFIDRLIQDIPKKVGKVTEHEDVFYNISDLIGNELKDYYHYTGSLTTHPYTETVNWAVLEHILEASPEQISFINQTEGNNARHIQSVNGRKIEIVHETGL